MNIPAYKLASVLVMASSVPCVPAQLYAGEKYLRSDDTGLSQGRELWLQNCESCHGYGIADAPVPMNPEEWKFRLSKGEQVLYENAINGYIGPDYSMMPARGGNENLGDEEVRLAVDYMVFLASYYIDKLDINEEVNNDSTTN